MVGGDRLLRRLLVKPLNLASDVQIVAEVSEFTSPLEMNKCI